jgi:hypothetical protein
VIKRSNAFDSLNSDSGDSADDLRNEKARGGGGRGRGKGAPGVAGASAQPAVRDDDEAWLHERILLPNRGSEASSDIFHYGNGSSMEAVHCPICTLINEPGSDVCAVCENPLPTFDYPAMGK